MSDTFCGTFETGVRRSSTSASFHPPLSRFFEGDGGPLGEGALDASGGGVGIWTLRAGTP